MIGGVDHARAELEAAPHLPSRCGPGRRHRPPADEHGSGTGTPAAALVLRGLPMPTPRALFDRVQLRLVLQLRRVLQLRWLCAALASGGCARGSGSPDLPRTFEIHRVEIEREADRTELLGFDLDGVEISRSAFDIDDLAGAARLERDDESFTVTIAPLTGGMSVSYERGPWQLTWAPEDGEPLDEHVTEAWNAVALGWREVLVSDDRLLTPVTHAINARIVDPPAELDEPEWDRACATVVDWQCARGPVAVTLTCRMAGAAWCQGLAAR